MTRLHITIKDVKFTKLEKFFWLAFHTENNYSEKVSPVATISLGFLEAKVIHNYTQIDSAVIQGLR